MIPTMGVASFNFLAPNLTETLLVSSEAIRAVQSPILHYNLRVNSCKSGKNRIEGFQ